MAKLNPESVEQECKSYQDETCITTFRYNENSVEDTLKAVPTRECNKDTEKEICMTKDCPVIQKKISCEAKQMLEVQTEPKVMFHIQTCQKR